MKVSLFFALIFTALIGNTKTLNEALAPLNKKQSDLGQTSLTKNVESKGEKKNYHTLGFEFKGAKYELEIVSPTSSSEFTSNRKNISTMIFKSYQDQPTPYQGVITNLAKCSKKFTPENTQIKIGNKEIFNVKSFVGSTFNYGVCEDKLVAHSACTTFYFEEQKLLYLKLKIFTKPTVNCTKVAQGFFETLTDL